MYAMKDYRVQQFRKSKTLNKKYDAILIEKKTGKEVIVPFGDSRYQHFNDKIGMYKHLDHGDIDRRRLYKLRHSGFIKKDMYSPGYFSMKYLW
jgi:hypothetical protein